MHPADIALSHARARRGFNLIEAAIVLGVVGLVIGGIWVAARAMSEQLKISETAKSVVVIAKNTQRLISIRDGGIINAGGNLNSALLGARALPSGWGENPANIRHPFGGLMYVINAGQRFSIYLNEVDEAACINLTTKISSYQGMELHAVFTNPGTGTQNVFYSFPVSQAQSNTACESINRLQFEFRYTRAN